MAAIQICKRCVNPSTRPNVEFDDEGICNVCRLNEMDLQGEIDWQARHDEIMEIRRWGEKSSKSSYDCIVTVSGGKDSTRQAFFVRDELGMNPLLVSSIYPPDECHDRGAENLTNLIEHGFDTITLGVNPQVFKTLMRYCFLKFKNLFNASEMALYAIPIHVAIAYKIPLIFLGENPAHTIGEKHGRLDGDASQMRHGNTIKGGKADIFLDSGVNKHDLFFYNYPPESDVQRAGLRLVYLGYYMKDWSGWNNAKFSIDHGLKTRDDSPENIGDLWGVSALDEDLRIVNQYLKYIKFGFGHVTDQVMERIHAGKMTREEGINLVKKFDGRCHQKYIQKLCDYLEITIEDFEKVVENARDKKLWKKTRSGDWELDVEY